MSEEEKGVSSFPRSEEHEVRAVPELVWPVLRRGLLAGGMAFGDDDELSDRYALEPREEVPRAALGVRSERSEAEEEAHCWK